VIGVVAVVVGSVLMLDRFGILNAGNVLRFWPVILIVVGLNNIIRDRTRGGLVGGGMMVIFGTIFLATQFGYVRWSQTWPIIIIGWGLLLIWDALRPKAYPSAQLDGSVDFIRAEMAEDKAFLNVSCVFGSVEVRIPTHWNVIIEANAVFGASENKTRPPVPTPTPKTLVIRGDAVFGSIEVKN
jgi:predicted membrane protein